jgi:hypothetical protein
MRVIERHRPPLQSQAWFLALLAAYAVFELSFNHRLLELVGDLQLRASVDQLHGIELWGRVVSGLGLALLLMRCLDRFVSSRLLLLTVSFVLGLGAMWHLQRALVDTIVARADHEDLVMSLMSQMSTQEALNGRVLLRGEPLWSGSAPDDIKPVMSALWTASVAGLSPDDLEVRSGAAQLLGHFFAPQVTAQQLRQSYRKTVMTPVALGASLLFGLLNLCQFFAGLGVLLMSALDPSQRMARWRAALLPLMTVICLCLSWWPGNEWVSSPAYSQVARPALWREKPFLAPFVEWSLRAEPAWARQVAWVHRALLHDFEFSNPLRHLLDPEDPSGP